MEKKRIKVLFVTQATLHHYRIPIFRIVNNDPNIDLTLGHCGENNVQDEMPEIKLKKKKIGPFYYYEGFNKLINDYDVVLCMSYTNNLSFIHLVLNKRAKKVVSWGIGVPASYGRKYGEAGNLKYRLLHYFNKKSDASLFYSEAPIKIFKEKGLPLDINKVFIANNTVEVIKQEINNEQKKSLLFIGTLYREKGLQILLDAYKEACGERSAMLPLNIVGGGDNFDEIKRWVYENHLDNKINMLGPIYDTRKKAELFQETIACISPQQAGLSVLESMGYGVPFITTEDAITGGEVFNILDGENGIRMKDISRLKDVLLEINDDKEKFFEMGGNAYDYYWKNRTPQIMADGIIAAIKFAYKQ